MPLILNQLSPPSSLPWPFHDCFHVLNGCSQLKRGGGICLGTISTGTKSEGEKLRHLQESCSLLLFPGGLWMVPLISGWALSKSWATRPSNALDSKNHRILQINTPLYLPSARYTAAHPASEFAVKLLVERREISPGGGFRHFSLRRTFPSPVQGHQRRGGASGERSVSDPLRTETWCLLKIVSEEAFLAGFGTVLSSPFQEWGQMMGGLFHKPDEIPRGTSSVHCYACCRTCEDWAKFSPGPSANQQFPMAPSAPIGLDHKFSSVPLAPLKT